MSELIIKRTKIAAALTSAAAIATVASTKVASAADGITIPTTGDPAGNASLSDIFDRVISTLLIVVGSLSVLMLIVGGIRYIVSGGDQNAVQAAKNTILYAVVGIVVSFVSFAAVKFVLGQLGGSSSTV